MYHGKEHIFYLDSSFSRHMTWFKSLLDYFLRKDGPTVTYEDNGKGTIKGIGTIKCNSTIFKNVPYIKGL